VQFSLSKSKNVIEFLPARHFSCNDAIYQFHYFDLKHKGINQKLYACFWEQKQQNACEKKARADLEGGKLGEY
jgi:hypothetical protein